MNRIPLLLALPAMCHLSRSLLLGCLIASTLNAATPQDFSVDLKATVSDTAPRISLSWSQRLQSNIESQKIHRRLKGATFWEKLADLTPTQSNYADATALSGVEYEYWMQRDLKGEKLEVAMGYLSAGVKVPEVHSRGTLLLVVDDTMSAPLATEIAGLTRDIASDGWTVKQINAPRNGTAASTKALIKAAYTADPDNVKAVYLLGRVPVPYSGWLGPDGHGARAFPADGYYADMDGTWTDTADFTKAGTTARNDNCAGDGKFDQSTFPGLLKLQLGRVDMARLTQAPGAATTETSLLRRYLRKEHDFRFKQGAYADIPRRALIREGFGYFAGENFSMNGWATAFTCVSPSSTTPFPVDNIPENEWFHMATSHSYLAGHISGSGGSNSFQGGGMSFEFGRKPSKVVFPSAFGSFSDDWDFDNAAMRTILAGNATGDSLALTCYWSGRPHYFTHHLGMGETFGYSILTTQNLGKIYQPCGNSAGCVHVGLLGDPTLRLHAVEPPRDLTATSSNNKVSLSWAASTETALRGYHVYRAPATAGPFTKLTEAPLTATTYTDTSCAAGQTYVYLVRTLILETSPGGSYYNLSHGDMLTVTVNAGAKGAAPNPTNLTVSLTERGKAKLSWKDNATHETGYRIERKTSSDGSYGTCGSIAANETSFTDEASPTPGATCYYRVCAMDGNTPSIPAETYLETAAGTFDFQTVAMMKVIKTLGTAKIPVERFGGVTGTASVTYTTADSSAKSGTHFTGGSGTLNWADGEGGVKFVQIPITNTPTPQTARQFRVDLSKSAGADIGQYKTMAVLIEDPTATLHEPWKEVTIHDDSKQTVYDSAPAALADGVIGSTLCGGQGLDSAMSWESGRFIYQQRGGDGMLTARVPAPTPAQPAGRFAIMIRESTGLQSKMVATVVTSYPKIGSKFIHRGSNKINSVLVPTATNSQTAPCWLRLVRAGNSFTSLTSTDGKTWTVLGTATVPMPETANWGFFHISNGVDYHRNPFSNYQLCEFQDVAFDKLPVPDPPANPAVGKTGISAVPLTWTGSPGASGYRIERCGEDGVFTQAADLTSGSDTSFNDTTVKPDTAYAYRILASGPAGNSPWSPVIHAATRPVDAVASLVAVADATLKHDSPTTNFGKEKVLTVHGTDDNCQVGPVTKAWMRFDLKGLPALKSAKLNLTVSATGGIDTVGNFFAYLKLLPEAANEWDEGTITWSNAAQNNTTSPGLLPVVYSLGTINIPNATAIPAPGTVLSPSLTVANLNTLKSSNGIVTIVCHPYDFSGSPMPAAIDFASHEHDKLAAPTLEVTYENTTAPRPSFLAVSTTASSDMALKWVDNSDNETGFEIERRVSNGSWAPLKTTAANVTGFIDTTAQAGINCEYRIRTTSTAGASSWASTRPDTK